MANVSKTKTPVVVSFILLLLSVAFIARGLQELLPSDSATQAKDLHSMWTEFRMVLDHGNPYGDKVNAWPYPPWAFLVDFVLYWPSWSTARAYFAVLNLACLLLLGIWAYRQAFPTSRYAIVLALSITAFSSNATGLGLGQNAIIYTTILVGSLVFYERGSPILCGLLIGIAMSKISITLPFLLPFVFRREWRVITAAGVYMLSATLLLALWVHSLPLEMMQSWVIGAQRFSGVAYGPASLLVNAGVAPTIADRSCALIVMSVAVVTMLSLRNLPIRVLFGLASGFGRLWTYHRVYDNVVLAFLLVALGDLYFKSGRRSTLSMFIIVGVTLWYPIRTMDVPLVHLIHVTIWSAGMYVLAFVATKYRPMPDEAEISIETAHARNYYPRR